MSLKIFHCYSWSIQILLIIFFAVMQMSHASENCEYKTDAQSQYYTKWCPAICCPYSSEQRRENTTCCVESEVYATVTTNYTLFGYPWWTISVCTICIFLALNIFIHYLKRLHLFKHSKYFNSRVDSAAAFTISKNALNLQLNNDLVFPEQNPPSYTSAVCPSPPPYASIKTIE